MYTLGIIEESLLNQDVLQKIKIYLFSQRTERVPTDENPEWHIGEYHVPCSEMANIMPILADSIKPNYYIHAFSEEELIVVLSGKVFHISKEKDNTWNAMIEYGVSVGVEKHYLESVPLSV